MGNQAGISEKCHDTHTPTRKTTGLKKEVGLEAQHPRFVSDVLRERQLPRKDGPVLHMLNDRKYMLYHLLHFTLDKTWRLFAELVSTSNRLLLMSYYEVVEGGVSEIGRKIVAPDMDAGGA